MKILQSASKLVFVLVAVATVVLAFLKIIDPKDFLALSSMVFAFYFTKSNPTSNQ